MNAPPGMSDSRLIQPKLTARWSQDGKRMSPTTEDQIDFHVYHLVSIAMDDPENLKQVVCALEKSRLIAK